MIRERQIMAYDLVCDDCGIKITLTSVKSVSQARLCAHDFRWYQTKKGMEHKEYCHICSARRGYEDLDPI